MKKNKILITLIFVIIIIVISGSIIWICKQNNENMNNSLNNIKANLMQNELSTEDSIKEINEIKNQINATANSNMYEVKEEYDGRKIIQINHKIQFKTILAGIIKGDKPEENEINDLIEKMPTKSGIWITEKSREKMIEVLKENNLNQFEIDEEGYVYTVENNGNSNYSYLKEKINGENLYIIDFSGRTYIRDEINGNIVENPFEEMDESQILERYTDKNITLISVIKNENKKFTNQEIFKEIILHLE